METNLLLEIRRMREMMGIPQKRILLEGPREGGAKLADEIWGMIRKRFAPVEKGTEKLTTAEVEQTLRRMESELGAGSEILVNKLLEVNKLHTTNLAARDTALVSALEDKANQELFADLIKANQNYISDLNKVYDNFLSRSDISSGLDTSLESFVINRGEQEGIKAFKEFYEPSLGKEVIDRYFERIDIINQNGLPTVRLKEKFKTGETNTSIEHKNLEKIETNINTDLDETISFTSEDDFVNYLKEKYPMSEDEASNFLHYYAKNTGRNPNHDFYSYGYSWAMQDYVKVAIVLKYRIKPPVGKYLYHGTSSDVIPAILEKGLDNSFGKVMNQGSMPYLGPGKTTATGDINKATTYSKSSAEKSGSNPVLIRFENTENKPITFFDAHPSVNAENLEFSFDGGKTWTKDPTKRSDLNLEKKTSKQKKIWDYQEEIINDNLVLIKNPKGGQFAKVISKKTPLEEVILNKRNDEFGEYYYMQAKMSNPRDAGISIKTLSKLIPKGSRFGEPPRGSLSTDSFYNMLRRTKDFDVKIYNYIGLNGSGVNRFQGSIKNVTFNLEYPQLLQWKNIDDAKILLDDLNSEIKKYGIDKLAEIRFNESKGLYEIYIPNIQFITK
jgi:hypothetical protein